MSELKNEMISLSETANLLGVSERTLRNWDRDGVFLPAIKSQTGQRKYRKDDVMDLIEQQKLKEYGFPFKIIRYQPEQFLLNSINVEDALGWGKDGTCMICKASQWLYGERSQVLCDIDRRNLPRQRSITSMSHPVKYYNNKFNPFKENCFQIRFHHEEEFKNSKPKYKNLLFDHISGHGPSCVDGATEMREYYCPVRYIKYVFVESMLCRKYGWLTLGTYLIIEDEAFEENT
jgi:DNA-binding transcriptional MerR regulator